jgi:molecular chaperone GrpE
MKINVNYRPSTRTSFNLFYFIRKNPGVPVCDPVSNLSFQVNFFHTRGASYLNYDKAFRQSLVNRGLRGHFVPFFGVGNILDRLTFAHNFETIMKKKNMQENGHDQNPDLNGSINVNTDENIAGDKHLNEPVAEESEAEALKAQIDNLSQQVSELNDRYLRQAAEFDNFRRRNAKERVELIQTAGKDVITDLLVVLDDSERAQKQMETTNDINLVKEGVQLVFSKLRNTLSAKGLKPMESIGKEFDADLHEAITQIDAGEEMQGKVVDEIQKGYYLNDKIIRHAKVVVGR